jgi:putative flavoprotein involved in K+ transport
MRSTLLAETTKTVIIGAGQAGLSLSYFLTNSGHEHVILEKSLQIADSWRNRRWDSFTLNSPNWAFTVPGAEYTGPEPDSFMLKDEIVRRFEAYQQSFKPDIRFSSPAEKVTAIDDNYRFKTTTPSGIIKSHNVVVATGMYHKVSIPPYSREITSSILLLPSDEYRNPHSLPPGAVLVVGSAHSGCQIAEELNLAGRKVFLSTCRAGRAPRRYRGIDIFHWLDWIGFFHRTMAVLASPRDRFFGAPHVTGTNGGHDINLHQFCRDGIVLLGHVRGFKDGNMIFTPDLRENLGISDTFAANIFSQMDRYIQVHGMDLPEEPLVELDDGYRVPIVQSLNLAAERISTIIWATGYLMDNSFVQLPILDDYNYPDCDRGVTRHRGLYFLGLNWMNNFNSGFLMGIAESAKHITEQICQ